MLTYLTNPNLAGEFKTYIMKQFILSALASYEMQYDTAEFNFNSAAIAGRPTSKFSLEMSFLRQQIMECLSALSNL